MRELEAKYPPLPSTNSADNNNFVDVLGTKTDTHSGDSLMAMSNELKEHFHKEAKCYPTLAGGVTVAGAAGAWTLGNFVEIVPASTITSDFDIHMINIEAVSAADVYELVLYAVETEIGRVRFPVLGTPANIIIPARPFMCPIIPANTQIQAKLATAGGGADTATISLFYHTY